MLRNQTNLPFKIREKIASDNNFILNSWLKSYKDVEKIIPNDIYYREHAKLIQSALKDKNIFVAVSEDDATQIIGYICYETQQLLPTIPILHYVYVKYPYRHLGVARALVNPIYKDAEYVFCSHLCKCFLDIRKDHKKLIYNPYAKGSL